MVWQESNYIEVDFDAEKFQQNAYKLYNEELLTHFKKVAPNCETIYFNVDESENIWYGKSKTGEIECFTLYGKHPETGKTLKPITKYMINKYFCESY